MKRWILLIVLGIPVTLYGLLAIAAMIAFPQLTGLGSIAAVPFLMIAGGGITAIVLGARAVRRERAKRA